MILFENDSTKAAFYFAAEEYIMRDICPDEAVIMLWSTDDTVMLGANQVASAEIDASYVKASGIEIVRRPSGGGAIFTDIGTLQYTVILPYTDGDDSKTVVRDWLAGPVIEAASRYGAEASLEGRNDIVIGGKKISGMAQHARGGYLCSHGSLLFNTNMEKLVNALTVDREKITTKAIASVSARVTNISEHITEKDMGRFREAMIESFVRKDAVLRKEFDTEGLEKINEIMRERFDNPEWTFGHEPAFTFTNKKRFSGGQIEVYLDVKGGVIRKAGINGDFLALRPVSGLEEQLEGVPHREESVREALRKADVGYFLGSLGADELTETMF
jgi:lipoate-protein ligase A